MSIDWLYLIALCVLGTALIILRAQDHMAKHHY